LFVEDEDDVASVLSEYLIEGFKTSCLADGNVVLPFVKQKSPSLEP
jgi:DNA-binding response OmpR family regulator